MVNIPTGIPDCGSHSPALWEFFISSDGSVCSTMAFPPLGHLDHVVVSVSFDFLAISKGDAPFHCMPYDYSRADWDGLRDHLRDVPWEDIFICFLNYNVFVFCQMFKGFKLRSCSIFRWISNIRKVLA